MTVDASHRRPSRIVVVGSVNMDLVARVPRLPRPGETVGGRSFDTIPGGKGANQAVAAARLGASVAMIGRVGGDAFAGPLIASLRSHGVEAGTVLPTPDCPSGIATIGVEDSGENAIIVVAGANGRVTPADVAAAEPIISAADTVLLQLEIPVESVVAAAALARRHGVRVVLNPAPAPAALPDELLRADAICPNETEAIALTGLSGDGADLAARQARWLAERGAGLGMVTLGARGAVYCEASGEPVHVPPFEVRAIDTTAAGDAFAGALAVALSEGAAGAAAVRFACAAGALAATRPGAQPAMPSRDEVELLINQQKGTS
ncbi:MAG: ribokinase [Thermoguttaceae bacterium]|jgi:ribokinase|nr:ribokinase [Thermoguttaceae bacterium]